MNAHLKVHVLNSERILQEICPVIVRLNDHLVSYSNPTRISRADFEPSQKSKSLRPPTLFYLQLRLKIG